MRFETEPLRGAARRALYERLQFCVWLCHDTETLTTLWGETREDCQRLGEEWAGFLEVEFENRKTLIESHYYEV